MRVSNLYAPTLREVPSEAEAVSEQLMLRAGLIRKVAPGLYNYLPLAWRVQRKITQICREAVDGQGGQEIMMAGLQPAEIWQETGRWNSYGEEMYHLKDRQNRNYCLEPSREETIGGLIRGDVRSHRQLPLLLYSIHNKFRDEVRTRSGLIRSREFYVKDGYSFDKDSAGLVQSYEKMFTIFSTIFDRCGLKYRSVEADCGTMGEEAHEFILESETGEAEFCFCTACGYAANIERAELAAVFCNREALKPLDSMVTPNCKTMEEVASFLGFTPEHAIKSLAFLSDKGPILALVRGDHTVNEIKLKNKLNCKFLTMADQETIIEIMGSSPGYIGPIAVKNTTIVADHTVMNMVNTECGANKPDFHYINVNPGRDFKPDIIGDIRLIRKGDPCPHCGVPVEIVKGIEMAKAIKMQEKYSELLKLCYLDETGTEQPIRIGYYGLGISRIMAAIVEQNYDGEGIIWPLAVAPFTVCVVPVNINDETLRETALKVYEELTVCGIETIFDDRAERAGVKFKDADLIGYPLRITIGPKSLKENTIECRIRRTGEVMYLDMEDYLSKIRSILPKL